jgi:DNA helicase-2/ATP-dependent DNA helicase PcrA
VSPAAAQRRAENLDGFLEALGNWETRTLAAMQQAGDTRGAPVTEYLHRLTLSANDDDDDELARGDQVTLVTLHGAKGLEYPVVFLVGLEEELLPHRRTLYPQGPDVSDGSIDLSEERRLLYVGITRARQLLYLTRTRSRGGRFSMKERSPSRFLAEVPAELCEARDLELPQAKDAADEEAFAREQLATLKAMVE